MKDRERFEHLFSEHIHRPGSEELLSWLKKTDFFEAPASTRFHANYPGGLLEHSLNVFDTLVERFGGQGNYDMETFAICGLLHDLCKAQFYKLSTRNVKNPDTGAWEQKPYYTVDDQFPFGHGEKSVFLIERFMRLKVEEAVAIRWHMGGFDSDSKAGGFAVSQAFDQYPLAVMLHLSDLEATYLREERGRA